jgi:hypothetical protein
VSVFVCVCLCVSVCLCVHICSLDLKEMLTFHQSPRSTSTAMPFPIEGQKCQNLSQNLHVAWGTTKRHVPVMGRQGVRHVSWRVSDNVSRLHPPPPPPPFAIQTQLTQLGMGDGSRGLARGVGGVKVQSVGQAGMREGGKGDAGTTVVCKFSKESALVYVLYKVTIESTFGNSQRGNGGVRCCHSTHRCYC